MVNLHFRYRPRNSGISSQRTLRCRRTWAFSENTSRSAYLLKRSNRWVCIYSALSEHIILIWFGAYGYIYIYRYRTEIRIVIVSLFLSVHFFINFVETDWSSLLTMEQLKLRKVESTLTILKSTPTELKHDSKQKNTCIVTSRTSYGYEPAL